MYGLLCPFLPELHGNGVHGGNLEGLVGDATGCEEKGADVDRGHQKQDSWIDFLVDFFLIVHSLTLT